MWSKWIDEAKKKTQQALETASVYVGETYKVAAQKANEISIKAGDKISDIFFNPPSDFTYITEHVVAMGFPGLPSHPVTGRDYNPTSSVSTYLENHHAGHYRIINLSEEKYDYTLFNNSVVEYNYYGLPNPSLGLLVKICHDIQEYLNEDSDNIICIHCLNGVGRTITLVSAYLAYSGVVDTCMNALSSCVQARDISMDDILPSQKQYLQYLDQLLLCIQPSYEPLLLKKVILKNIPTFENQGFKPVFDIYVNGEMKYITNNGKKLQEIKSLNPDLLLNEIEFNLPMKGNVFIRCRNYGQTKKLKSVFSFMFYTGFVKLFTLQYHKSTLDHGYNNKYISDSFEIVLQFDSLSDSEFNDNEQYTNLIIGKKSFWMDLAKQRNEVKEHQDNAFAIGKNKYTNKRLEEPKKTDSRNYLDEINQLENQLSQEVETSNTIDSTDIETNDLDQLMKEMEIATSTVDVDNDNTELEDFSIEDLDKALSEHQINTDTHENIQEDTQESQENQENQENIQENIQENQEIEIDVDENVDVENIDAGDIVEEQKQNDCNDNTSNNENDEIDEVMN